MSNEERDRLDEWIDGALRGYSDAEPLARIEDRVLNRVRAARTARRRSWRLAFAVPALAALVVVVWIVWRQQPAVAPPQVPVAAIKPPAVLAPPVVSSVPVAKRRHRPVRHPLPMHEYFPAPSPVTAEEKALFAWARRSPAEAQHAFADLRRRNEGPIVIQKIEIAPLEADGAYQGEDNAK